jgi:hypothetical protein
MEGGIENAARARAIQLGLDIEIQLDRLTKPGFQPVLYMLRDARERAISAMTNLALVDPTDQMAIRKLQLEIMLFDDMVAACKRAVDRGREQDRLVTEEERAEINSLIAAHEGMGAAERLGATGVNDQ